MTKNWVFISIGIGIISGIIAYLFVQNWKLSLVVTILVTVISLVFNPKLFYARISLFAFSALIGLNKFSFEFIGKILDIDFKIQNDTANTTTTIVLFIITILCLILFFLERNDKLKGTFLDFSSKDNKKASIDITGDGNIVTVIQSNDAIRKKEATVELYTSNTEEKINDLQQRLKDKVKIEGLLDKEVLKLSQELEELKKERDRLEQEVENIIDKNKSEDLVKESDTYKQVFKLFSKGNIDKALNELEDDKLEIEEIKTSNNRKQESKLRMLKAQMLRVKHNYKEAGENYEKAVNLHGSYENCFEVAHYFQFINEFKKAEKYYYKCLDKVTSKAEKATTLNNLGVLQSDQNEHAKAEKSYQEALLIRRELTKLNPQTYLPKVGTTLNNLGSLQSDQNEYTKAEKSYEEALIIYRELAEVNPQTYLPDVGMILNNLGVLQRAQNEFKKLRNRMKKLY
ncbi:hypothetical protein IMCC3317_04170 [Kordia antarctica]|uniref:Photosystem I assembly protein Ycf3 n=1 Tax=Kordia antarctica TaxID=1218801 RepID=A0A7L4ZF34_9FLAO|nr:tetratricopeptide repeat protein [Kordia antarctica]QHI35071.1 hypothetical protein IMCC3317_04170 [Kordia antarctica]